MRHSCRSVSNYHHFTTRGNTFSSVFNFSELNETTVLMNLKKRYDQELTYIGSILVSVNPYKLLNIYVPHCLSGEKPKNTQGHTCTQQVRWSLLTPES
uniref:Myosin motor domain-containing protein n=1 Tax=Stegastes partitus TaxID=144197 RepID=A0A3B5ALV9_9TELE